MAHTENLDQTPHKAGLKKPIIIGALLALLGAGAGFYATTSSLLSGGQEERESLPTTSGTEIAFIPLEPLVISLNPPSKSTHLRFRAELEVPKIYEKEVELLKPRIIDVLNSYLRALDTEKFEEPSALVRLRSQMLRRVELVVGQGHVNDLLVMEFVLN